METEQTNIHNVDEDAVWDWVDCVAGALAQWIFVPLGLIECVRHGDVLGIREVEFRVPLGELRAVDVLGLLERHGIGLYGWTAWNGLMLVHVCKDDARRTEAIFRAYGVPTV